MNQSEDQTIPETYKRPRHYRDNISQSIWNLAPKAISLFSIGLGAILLVSGLLMLFVDGSLSSTRASLVSNNFLSTVAQFPGIPFNLTDLTSSPAAVGGIVVWVLGIDIMLVGLGLWIKNKLARYFAVTVFGIAAFFDFTNFLLSGVLGAPSSVTELLVNSALLYCLFKNEIWAEA